MWDDKKSIFLSRTCVKIFMALYGAALITAPFLVGKYVELRQMDRSFMVPALLITLYLCALPAGKLLWDLHRLLFNISRDKVFIDDNVALLRSISWCCIAAGLICLFSCFYYIIFLFLAIAAAFFGLIIRVVKNIIRQAVLLKDENDFTI